MHERLLQENLGIFTSFLWISRTGDPRGVLKLCPTAIPVILAQGVSVGIRGSGTGWKQRQVSATCGAAKLTGSREFSFGSLTVTAVVWED